MKYVTKSRAFLENDCAIVEIDGEFYQDKPRAGLKKLRTFIQITNHKYGKSIAYEYIDFYNYKTHKGMHMSYHAFLYAWYKGEVPAGYDVDHIDNDSLNNDINNLQLLTRAENIKKRGGGKNQYTAARERGIEVDRSNYNYRRGKRTTEFKHRESFYVNQKIRQAAKAEAEQKAAEEKQKAKKLKKIKKLEEQLEIVKSTVYKYKRAKQSAIDKINEQIQELRGNN